MIRVEGLVRGERPADEVFRYVADFRNLPRWDPGIAEVQRLDTGSSLEVGARLRVVARFLGRRVPLDYRLTRYDPDARLAEYVGETSGLTATDRIEVREAADGSVVIWKADFELAGARRLLEPLARPLFERLGRKAMAGLSAALGPSSFADHASAGRLL